MSDFLIASIQSFGPFAPEQIALLLEKFKMIFIKKDEFLIKEGQICQSFYWLKSGSFRHYHTEDSGEEATLNLFIPNDWVLEYQSFMRQKPSLNNIVATTDSEAFALSISDFHALARASESFMRMGKILELAVSNQDFQQSRLSPEQKYALLMQTKPALLQHFPLKQIASFMGMAPETLSRVRKKISS